MPRATRRQFLSASGALVGGFLLGTRPAMARTRWSIEKLEIGLIGTANRATANIHGVAAENITAICDVDDGYLDAVGARFGEARRFNDLREMLSEMKFDAVVVSTADHTHAAGTLRALQQGVAQLGRPMALAHGAHLVGQDRGVDGDGLLEHGQHRLVG